MKKKSAGQGSLMKKPHPIVNKLKYALRHSKMWSHKVVKDKKKESKKKGYYVIEEYDSYDK
jgi:hypothetical protein